MAVTLTWDAPLSMGTKPRDLFLRHEPSGPVLALVESFPGAMSPLRSKELYDLILSLHPSYKSQHERKILNDNKTAPFVPSINSGRALNPVEGLRRNFSGRAKKFQSWVSTFSVFGGRF
jgi:hypothetical protein